MDPVFLCSAIFPKEEAKEIGRAAKTLGISRAELVRRAVRRFSAECVTTHKTAKKRTA